MFSQFFWPHSGAAHRSLKVRLEAILAQTKNYQRLVLPASFSVIRFQWLFEQLFINRVYFKVSQSLRSSRLGLNKNFFKLTTFRLKSVGKTSASWIFFLRWRPLVWMDPRSGFPSMEVRSWAHLKVAFLFLFITNGIYYLILLYLVGNNHNKIVNVFLIKPPKVMEFFHIKECRSLLKVERQNIDVIKCQSSNSFAYCFCPWWAPKIAAFSIC